MGRSAFIKFVKGSKADGLTLEQLQDELNRYKSETAKTGMQLNWDYTEAAFPYTIETKPESKDQWFYLKGTNDKYRYIVFGTGSDGDTNYVQVVLPDGSTHGDVSKANEFCKYLAKRFEAELHLFNSRIMYFNPRK